MNIVGAIGTVAALANYRKAKSEYETLVEKREGLISSMSAYDPVEKFINEQRELSEKEYIDEQVKELEKKANVYPDGLKWSVMLRIGNLVGKLFRAQPSITLTNTSSQSVFIVRVEVACEVLDSPIVLMPFSKSPQPLPDYVFSMVQINPGETIVIDLPKGITSLADKQGDLRNIICKQAGKRLITSCPKMNVDGGYCKADVRITWEEKESGDKENYKNGYTIGVPCVLRYCGEAFL